MMWDSGNGISGAATLMHTIYALCRRIAAKCYLAKLGAVLPGIGSLSEMAEALLQVRAQVWSSLYARVPLHDLKNAGRQALESASYEWLGEQKRGSAVQFVVSRTLDHVVCFDDRR